MKSLRDYRSEHRLMLAVLEETERTLQHGGTLAQESRDWITQDDDRWPFSFLNICHYLGLSPEYLRRGFHHYQVPRKHRGRAGELLPPGIHSAGAKYTVRPYCVTTRCNKKSTHYLFASLEEAVAFRAQYEQEKLVEKVSLSAVAK